MDNKTNSFEKDQLVLFVDDEKEILNAIKRQFSLQSSFTGIFETNPTRVLDLIEENPVKIVVADIVMPEKDGITLLTEIKEKYPDVIRILLTAHGDYNTSLRAIKEADVFGFITKPWDKNYLFGHLNMASKSYDIKKKMLNQQLTEDERKENLPLIMVVDWDDVIGTNIIKTSAQPQNWDITDIAKRCFMSSTGFFGREKRFNGVYFTFPISDLAVEGRVYLNKIKEGEDKTRNYGIIYIFDPIINPNMNDVDNVLKLISDNYSKNHDLTEMIDKLSRL
ncbi:MAG: response regulator [Candidatus Heimdallarchaeota archaeon]|nr:response regulator [Candidatus Heimdallarchaeota archaeon]MDH5644989.1 response regulator [Candidatus Heimdallarchaeota archaeon]